jgi:hypothetical protein
MKVAEPTEAAANKNEICTGSILADEKINANIVEVKVEAVNAGI